MVLHEFTVQDQISVDLDDVFAAAGGNGLVADGGQPESPVLMPDVVYGNRRDVLEMLHDISGADARTVVRDQDLGRHYGLLHDAVETQIEGARPVVGGNYQGNCHDTVRIYLVVWLRPAKKLPCGLVRTLPTDLFFPDNILQM